MDWKTLLASLKQIEKDDPSLLDRKVLYLHSESGPVYINFTMLHDGKTIMFIDDYEVFAGVDTEG